MVNLKLIGYFLFLNNAIHYLIFLLFSQFFCLPFTVGLIGMLGLSLEFCDFDLGLDQSVLSFCSCLHHWNEMLQFVKKTGSCTLAYLWNK